MNPTNLLIVTCFGLALAGFVLRLTHACFSLFCDLRSQKPAAVIGWLSAISGGLIQLATSIYSAAVQDVSSRLPSGGAWDAMTGRFDGPGLILGTGLWAIFLCLTAAATCVVIYHWPKKPPVAE